MPDENALINTQDESETSAGSGNLGASPGGVGTQEGSGTEQSNGSGGRNGANAYNAQRRVQQKMEREIGELRSGLTQILESLKQAPQAQAAPAAKPQSADFWSDPDGYFARRDEALKRELQEAISHQEQTREKAAALQIANEIIESQEDVQSDPEAIGEIKDVAKRYHLHRILENDPQLAAQMALDYWRKERGVSSPVQSQRPVKSQAAAVNGSAGASGKKIWKAAEITELRMHPEKYEKFREEILDAINEGRVRR